MYKITVQKFAVSSLRTGKSFSEALIVESVNPQYDKRLFIEFLEKYKFKRDRPLIICQKCSCFFERQNMIKANGGLST